MPWNVFLITGGLLAVGALLLALQRGDGCRASLGRNAGLLLGGVGPLVALWVTQPRQTESVILLVLVLIGGLILNVAALMLGASAIQTLVRGALRDDMLDGAETLFKMDHIMPSSSRVDSDDFFYMIFMLVFFLLFIAGVLLGGLFDGYLMPKEGPGALRRALRILLSLLYAAGLHIGAVALVLWGFGALAR